MYSYSRPAYLFWQGVYDYLISQGLTHEKAIDVLQHKDTRWMLDHHGDEVKELGRKMAKKYFG